ncbi:MAG: hypothetical protein IPG38_05660 [Chitinophagaceae bacterium]|nr:hypothetical protein [Chitinophagaceae bacterium]
MNQLEQRVKKLEKSLQAYRIFFSTSLVIFFAVVLISSGKKDDVPDIIKAKAFQVVDNSGNVLVLMNKEKGSGQLATYSSSGQKLVRLFTSESDAGAINTFDPDGNLNFKITNNLKGGGYLAMYNTNLKEVVELGVLNSKDGYLQVNDNNGGKLAKITATTEGGGHFSLTKEGKETITISAASPGGRLSIYDNTEKRIGYFGTQSDLSCNLSVYNNSGTRIGGFPTY